MKENHEVYYLVYELMLETGARYTHVLKMLEKWNPGETVDVPGVGLVTRRLVCFEDKGFRRYYMGPLIRNAV